MTGVNGVPSGWTVLTAIPAPEAVDLGLPSGVKWASCNLGANAPEEYGDFYAWGETSTKENFDDDEGANPYQWYYDYNDHLEGYRVTKYCPSSKSSYWKGTGSVDNIRTLLPEDDVVSLTIGDNWRIPTKSEYDELIANSTITNTTMGGNSGKLFTSNINGNTVFFPAAGTKQSSTLYNRGVCGTYWSSSLDIDDPDMAEFYSFSLGTHVSVGGYRSNGLSIRAVLKE